MRGHFTSPDDDDGDDLFVFQPKAFKKCYTLVITWASAAIFNYPN